MTRADTIVVRATGAAPGSGARLRLGLPKLTKDVCAGPALATMPLSTTSDTAAGRTHTARRAGAAPIPPVASRPR